ncbi:hypothetical protein VTK73DRAFT_2873 [Phialemonium thermophilum]|uniref:glucan 1,3-beta-glucosidase n=1 Tax=Phialemonium thermophilum TaxID=223376 RepID=A0ABR3VN01_9PEZI
MSRGGDWAAASTDHIMPAAGAAGSTEKLGQASPARKSRRTLWILLGLVLTVLVVAGAVVGGLVAKNVIRVGTRPAAESSSSSSSASSGSSDSGGAGTATSGSSPSSTGGSSASQATASSSATSASGPKPTEAACTKPSEIPSSAKGTWTDPTSWLDMTDFNCTFTDERVGGLPVVGLFSDWDDSARANPNVPPLNKPWGSYDDRPIRGVSLGGWLSLEPFITPSIFDGAVDEYSLCAKLGPKKAAATLEKHYATFVTEDDFKSIAAAGLDHVRIPFSYWAVAVYDDDPYVFGVSWRYLLRGIEWARKHGLRVKLDMHGLPGSQNGWNHSGRQGKVDWLAGPDGATNAKRSLDVHDRLSRFFAQDRYKNVLAFYGLANEPAMSLDQDALIDWTAQAYKIVRGNGVDAPQVFSEALRGLPAWAGKLTGYGDKLVIDVHEYTIFDVNLIKLAHADRVAFACKTFGNQIDTSMDPATGFGPTMVGEWSQADTDCTEYLNGVGNGARWDGTYSGMTSPACPTADKRCSCPKANADPSTYTSDYKRFLLTWAEAQMDTFEQSWGWFYWTWKTESAPLWSYQAGLAGKFLPPRAYQRSWSCSDSVPSFGSLPEFY